jgi:hypothetical protein
MKILWSLIAGATFWIAGWAFGLKAFDTFMVLLLLLVVATAVRIAEPYVKRQLGRS